MITTRRNAGPVVLALDQGTSSSRALVVDQTGTVLAIAQEKVDRLFPHPGWVEQDAEAVWAAQMRSAAAALAQSGATAADVAAIGITNQRETTILWDRATAQPIGPAIVWQDRRTAPFCERLRDEGHDDLVRRKTGLLLDPYFSATKIAWLLEHVEGARARAETGALAFGTVDTWLAWRLTDGALHVTDPTNACRTLLYDIHAGDWDDELLSLFDVPRALLPEIRDTTGVVGHTQRRFFGAPLPLGALVGDQQSALFGQACTQPGMAKATYGTGCFLLMHTGATPAASHHGLLTTVALQRNKRREYALEGSVFMAGAAAHWLRDGLGLFTDISELAPLAASVPSSEGVTFVPALAGLGAPHWDAEARGAFFGLTAGTTRGHIARAAVEGIACQVVDLCTAVTADAGIEPSELRVDGGAAANDTLMQIQADLLALPVLRAAEKEATALGAAALAGQAVGLWDATPPVHANWRAERTFAPRADSDRELVLARWHAAVAGVRRFGSPGSDEGAEEDA